MFGLSVFIKASKFHPPFGKSSHPTPCSTTPSPASPPPSLTASKINFQQEQQVPCHLGLLAASAGCKQLSLFPLNQPPNFSAIPSLVFPLFSPARRRGRVGSGPTCFSPEVSPIPVARPWVGFRAGAVLAPAARQQSWATSPPVGKDGCVNWQEEHRVEEAGAMPDSQRLPFPHLSLVEAV